MGRTSVRARGKPGMANMTLSPERLSGALIVKFLLRSHTFPGPGAVVNTDHVDAIGASANRKPPELANGKRRCRVEALHRRARGQETAIHGPAEFFEPSRGIHDIAVEHDGAF